jgi:hypothetical protein
MAVNPEKCGNLRGWISPANPGFGVNCSSGGGYNPDAGLARYKDAFAGTTVWGGPAAYGTVYKILTAAAAEQR